jgi:DNA-binding transcriptional MerR regulator/methylmalonyl-CoA mutase cobalamin-binding subunit
MTNYRMRAMKKQQQKPSENARHPIQVVARRTGLGADVIRVWERRYGAVAPTRDTAGRRLYSDADIDRLLLLRRATEGGRRIGDVARLDATELGGLVADDQTHPQREQPTAGAPAGRTMGARYLETCLAAVRAVSPVDLEAALQQAAVALSTPALLDQVLMPLLKEIGERCRAGDLRVSQEHAATAVLRTFLAQLTAGYRASEHAPVLVVATPAGQRHELGALMAALSAAAEGWKVVYLGPDLPAEEIAYAALETHAPAVALSIVYPPDDPRVADELRRLHRALPAEATLFVGGLGAGGYEPVLKEIAAVSAGDLYEFRRRLDQLRKTRL